MHSTLQVARQRGKHELQCLPWGLFVLLLTCAARAGSPPLRYKLIAAR